MVINIQKIILIQSDGKTQSFNGLANFQKWQLNSATSMNRRAALTRYREWVQKSEFLLERKYHLPPSTLDGLLAAVVTLQEADRILSNEKTRELFTNSKNIFIVQISQTHPLVIVTIHTKDNIHVMKVGLAKANMQSAY